MRVTFLGKGGSGEKDCPTLYATDRDTYLVQGWATDVLGVVEIPHLLPGFADEGTYLGAMMSDTGRGTFLLVGRPVDDPEILAPMTIAEDETVIEVPRLERTFYGAAFERRRCR
ncbi:hypothetical protein IU449_27400 [Nocardia higoensis]|uniref:Uncharacterized protein n=1 Tax=Nocardia higoensis TaxID=228599 RepID=A0ABS0DNG2_9NOCA|nr:hypothetical protein [Nocardia higoensis]MBF6358228.1 hypothetical protein [Nocardia higoensis]